MRNELRLKNSVPRVFSLKTVAASGDLPRGEFNIVRKGRIFIMTLGRGCIPPMNGAAGAFSPPLSDSLSLHSPMAAPGIFICKGLGTTRTKLWAALHGVRDSHCLCFTSFQEEFWERSFQAMQFLYSQKVKSGPRMLRIS